jgi:hypothetical protein
MDPEAVSLVQTKTSVRALEGGYTRLRGAAPAHLLFRNPP